MSESASPYRRCGTLSFPIPTEEVSGAMPEILTDIVRHASAWYGRDLTHDSSWIVHLRPEDLQEIAAAVAQVKARGLAFAALRKQDFPLPTLAPRLRTWLEN